MIAFKLATLAALLGQTGMLGGSSGPKLSQELRQDEARESASSVKNAAVAEHTHQSRAGKSAGSEVMVINPHDLARDFKEVYDYLSTQRSAGKITFTLKNGQAITNIADIILPSKGSMLVFKQNTTQGLRYKVVKVEDIQSIEQQ